jgi:hypothetical protein
MSFLITHFWEGGMRSPLPQPSLLTSAWSPAGAGASDIRRIF